MVQWILVYQKFTLISLTCSPSPDKRFDSLLSSETQLSSDERDVSVEAYQSSIALGIHSYLPTSPDFAP